MKKRKTERVENESNENDTDHIIEQEGMSMQHLFKQRKWLETRSKQGSKGRTNKGLKAILFAENYDSLPATTPTYQSIQVGVSVRPSKKYCDLTGYSAPYTHPGTQLRYASADLYQVIEALPRDAVEAYLRVRNAFVAMK